MMKITKLSVIITLIFFCAIDCNALSITPKFASVTADGGGGRLILYTNQRNETVIYKSSNQLSVDENGNVVCLTKFDPKNCNVWVAAIDKLSGNTDTCKISIVPWITNLSNISIDKSLFYCYALSKSGDSISYISNKTFYKTGDDFAKKKSIFSYNIGTTTDYYRTYLKTPFGSFIRDGYNIYFSKDDRNWMLDLSTKGGSMNSSFIANYNREERKTSVFTADYIAVPLDSIRCGVYRKIIDQSNINGSWKKIVEFPSAYESVNNRSIINACRHIHTITTDPYTGNIWMGTGDVDENSHIYYSADNGDSWKRVGFGSQMWRVLSIWFTKDYIYWSTDTEVAQKIFRIPRSVYNEHNEWPDMTQRVDSGLTKIGVRYYIQKSNKKNFTVGNFWIANYQQQLDSNLVFYSLDDPKLDYREKVIDLPNNAIWDNMWAINSQGDSILLLTTDAEGTMIDNRARIFGVKENPNKTVDVQELISEEALNKHSRFLVHQQTKNNKIYISALELAKYQPSTLLLMQATLNWKDNCSADGGEIVKESKAVDSTSINLKLINYIGKIKAWQSATESFNWTNLIASDSIDGIADSLYVTKERNKVKYIRALVQKENDIPVPSKFVEIDSIQSLNHSLSETLVTLLENKIYYCYPTVFKDVITINFNNDTISDHTIELSSADGQLVFRKYIELNMVDEYKLSLSFLQKGVYVLKISNKNTVCSQ